MSNIPKIFQCENCGCFFGVYGYVKKFSNNLCKRCKNKKREALKNGHREAQERKKIMEEYLKNMKAVA